MQRTKEKNSCRSTQYTLTNHLVTTEWSELKILPDVYRHRARIGIAAEFQRPIGIACLVDRSISLVKNSQFQYRIGIEMFSRKIIGNTAGK